MCTACSTLFSFPDKTLIGYVTISIGYVTVTISLWLLEELLPNFLIAFKTRGIFSKLTFRMRIYKDGKSLEDKQYDF